MNASTCTSVSGSIGTLLVGLVWILLSFTLFYSHVGFFPQPDGSCK